MNQQDNQIRKLRAKGRVVQGSHDFGTASTGTEQIAAQVMIVDGEHAGQSCTWYGSFTERARERAEEQLRIAGWDGTWHQDMPGLGSTEFDLQYEETTTPNGAVYLDGNFINRIGVALKNRMDDAQKADFFARMRGSSAATQRRANGPAAQHPVDDDLKF